MPKLLYTSAPGKPAAITNGYSEGVKVNEPFSQSPVACNISDAISYSMKHIPGFEETARREDFCVDIYEVSNLKAFHASMRMGGLLPLSEMYAATIPLGTPGTGVLQTQTFIDDSRTADFEYPEKLLSTMLHEAALITFFANVTLQKLQTMSPKEIETEMFKAHIQALEDIMKLEGSPYSKDRLEEVLKEERRFASSWQ